MSKRQKVSRAGRIVLVTLGMSVALVTTHVGLSARQAPAAPAPAPQTMPMSETVFKNIQVMKGVPTDELMGAMGYISNALAVNCTYCHLGEGGGGWVEYARDNAAKQRARQMIVMMQAINRTYFGGRRVVTCVSCHNGSIRPKVTSDMAAYYSAPTTDEPDTLTRQAPGAPSADQVIDKYITAIGGAQRVGAVTSLVGKGAYLSYGEAETRPLDLYAKAPNQRSLVLHTFSGDQTFTYDGRNGWVATPEAFTPVTLNVLRGAELEGAKLEAELLFPMNLKTALGDWKGAVPSAMGDKDVMVVQGTMAGSGFPAKLYFDDETGLLLRTIRYTETPYGRNTWMTDYDDYRDVSGVKVPFKFTVHGQSSKTEITLTELRANAPVEASRFARPAPGRAN